jgi:drug/metabolite transporter (DMT)-like permease
MTTIAFIGMSLVWSFSWFAMKLQADSFLPGEISVFYRFALSSLAMFALCVIAKQRLVLRKKEIPYFAAIGLSNFCLNFLIGYYAVKMLPSGVVAVTFSLSIITSEIISSFVDGRKIEKKVLLSSLIGFIGLGFFILPTIDFSQKLNTAQTLTGFALSLTMMVIFSTGNVLVGKNKRINSTPLYTTIAYGSGFGSLYLLLINLARGNKFAFDFSAQYVFSLLYLIIFATVIAFICLFYLIQKIGSAKANYTALVYPAIALLVSAHFENFSLNIFNAVGFFMILSALVIEFMPKNFRLFK